nr:hypothetical protein [bacterium]
MTAPAENSYLTAKIDLGMVRHSNYRTRSVRVGRRRSGVPSQEVSRGYMAVDKRLAELKEKLMYERNLLLEDIGRDHRVPELSTHGDLADRSADYSQREMLLGLAEHDRERLLALEDAL